ncbi:hypothetical protein [Flexivirga alba]|uniref:Glycosyltransferase RgtA/B/C/D-like domain-containing protein n=1 Tax=Flexivirga alba TaxID=702742 RepID=A0ABW2AAT7_9MICO
MPPTDTAGQLDADLLISSAHTATNDLVTRNTLGRHLPGAAWFVLAGLVVMLSALATQGADLFWGVAMGDHIRAGLGIPQSVPFAAAPSRGWANPLALGEVVLSAVHSLGSSSLLVLHLTLVTAALGVLLAHGQAHQRESRASTALVLVVFGGATTFAIARMPSLSFLPYAVLVVLLLQNADRPSRRLWLTVPLLCLWGNLHGGVLVGCALLAVHLVCVGGPLRRRTLVGSSAFAAVLLATSAGWHTVDYYRGVLGNEAARQGAGLWAPTSVHRPFDLIMLGASAGLVAMWSRSHPRRWEVVAVVGMAVATLVASRNSIWLLLFLLPLAARGRSSADYVPRQRFPFIPAAAAVAMLLAGIGWQLTTRGSAVNADGAAAVPAVQKLAAGRTVLTLAPVAETFAQAGIRVWASNPIDAFPRDVQRQYLAFVDHGSIPSTPRVGLIVVDNEYVSQVREAGWSQVAVVSNLHVFEPPARPREGKH